MKCLTFESSREILLAFSVWCKSCGVHCAQLKTATYVAQQNKMNLQLLHHCMHCSKTDLDGVYTRTILRKTFSKMFTLLIVDERIVVRAIKSFPAGTAPGPSGLRASHLKEALFCSFPRASSQFVSTISRLVSMLSSGRVPSTIIPHLCGASLIALKKKSGGLRPIAVGRVLRRLTSKCLLLPVMAEANSILFLHQVGVNVRFGCEAIVHSINSVLGDSSIAPDCKWVLQVDFSNAFNCVDRSFLLQEVCDRMPSLSAWVECCYRSQPILHLDKDSINSCAG